LAKLEKPIIAYMAIKEMFDFLNILGTLGLPDSNQSFGEISYSSGKSYKLNNMDTKYIFAKLTKFYIVNLIKLS